MWQLIPSRAARRAPPIHPSRLLFFGLVGGFMLCVLPHVQQLPMWVIVAVIAGMVYRSVGEVRRWRLPSTIFSGALALCLLGAVYYQFGTIFGRDAGTAFMTALLALKFFELRSGRDIALIIFCSFFVVMSSLLYSQDVELFIYCLVMMWVLTALLLRTSMGDQPGNRPVSLLGSAALIFLQAFPLALFLFFFFPRYHGVLRLGNDETSIGLTDKIEPGSISRLANDDSTAMTAKITGEGLLNPETMYWRAIVLWNYDHDTWTPGDGSYVPKKRNDALPSPPPGGSLLRQEITIYPTFRRWLFALDYPVTLAERSDGTPGWAQALNGGVLSVRDGYDPVSSKERYIVTSSTVVQPQDIAPDLLHAALALPHQPDDSIDPRVQALATRLEKGCRTEDDYMRAVLYYFRHGGFRYSEIPGARGKDALADFLLKSKVGFCEHYASAFAVLMRLNHIPARLVAGYQGAQFNPYNGLYVVKQSNAHSWDEVWIASEKSWRRVDPTAILSARENLTTPSDNASTGGISIDLAGQPYTLISDSLVPNWVRRTMLETQLRRQEVEAGWNDLIFSYDPETQSRLARALGFHSQFRTVLGLFCIGAVALCGVIIGLSMKRRVKVSPVEDFYAKFCRSMAQRGAPRAAWEGPVAYTERIAGTFPQDKEVIAAAGRIVAGSRYAPDPPPMAPAELKSLLTTLGTSRSPSSSTTHES